MWQLLILFYFIFGTASYLLRRILAQKLGHLNRLVNSVFFLFFLLPTGAILSLFFPHNLNVGIVNLLLLFFGSLVWPVYDILAFHANRKVDVGIYAIINNLSPIFTLLVAIPFLHEKLSEIQFIGIALLILSGILAAASQRHKHSRAPLEGVLICLLSTIVVGVAISYERFMLTRVDFGTYIIFGWGSQIMWAAIIVGKDLKKLPSLFANGAEARHILILWGLSYSLTAVAFINALKASSASIMSAASDFMTVAVIIVAYFYLKEREHMVYKWTAAGIGIAGLLLIAK